MSQLERAKQKKEENARLLEKFEKKKGAVGKLIERMAKMSNLSPSESRLESLYGENFREPYFDAIGVNEKGYHPEPLKNDPVFIKIRQVLGHGNVERIKRHYLRKMALRTMKEWEYDMIQNNSMKRLADTWMHEDVLESGEVGLRSRR